MECTFAIDTSGRGSFLAIWDGAKVFSVSSDENDSHAESLALLFAELLGQANCRVSDIKEILFGSGPGSFTGLRIGLAFAKGIACANLAPIHKISSLTALARSEASETVCSVAAADARREECFFQAHIMVAGRFIAINSPEIIGTVYLQQSVENLLQERGLAEKRIVTVWSDTQPSVNLAENLIYLHHCNGSPLPAEQGTVGLTDRGQFYMNLADIEPDYVRAVAARKISERT